MLGARARRLYSSSGDALSAHLREGGEWYQSGIVPGERATPARPWPTRCVLSSRHIMCRPSCFRCYRPACFMLSGYHLIWVRACVGNENYRRPASLHRTVVPRPCLCLGGLTIIAVSHPNPSWCVSAACCVGWGARRG